MFDCIKGRSSGCNDTVIQKINDDLAGYKPTIQAVCNISITMVKGDNTMYCSKFNACSLKAAIGCLKMLNTTSNEDCR